MKRNKTGKRLVRLCVVVVVLSVVLVGVVFFVLAPALDSLVSPRSEIVPAHDSAVFVKDKDHMLSFARFEPMSDIRPNKEVRYCVTEAGQRPNQAKHDVVCYDSAVEVDSHIRRAKGRTEVRLEYGVLNVAVVAIFCDEGRDGAGNCTGSTLTVYGNGKSCYQDPSVVYYINFTGSWNNNIESTNGASGCNVRVYENYNYQGASEYCGPLCYSHGLLSNEISSAKIAVSP